MIKEKPSFLGRLLRSKVTIILEVLVLVLISVALVKEVVRRYQIQGEIKKLQTEAQQLEKKNTELGSLVSRLSNGAYKEEQARLKLGLQKPGESVAVVLGESTDGNQSAATAEPVQQADTSNQTIPNPKRWWNYFFLSKNDPLES